ncbi:oxidoreductase [Streptomyces albidoflavus]
MRRRPRRPDRARPDLDATRGPARPAPPHRRRTRRGRGRLRPDRPRRRPVADGRSNGLPAVSSSPNFNPRSLGVIRQASRQDIARITRGHAEAARLAVDAGFDVVEIHLGHNYFASSFLSPKLNKRKDEYGGSLAHRARVARDAARAVREAVGDRIAILAKLNLDDGVPGGLWLDESLQVAQWLQADGSVHALELTAGSSSAPSSANPT